MHRCTRTPIYSLYYNKWVMGSEIVWKLSHLTISSNKKIASENFSSFSTISSHHKWNGTRLLSPESEYMFARVAERIKTWDLRKLGNFMKVPEMLGFDGEYSSSHLKAKFWGFSAKSGKISAVKHFVEKPIFLIS